MRQLTLLLASAACAWQLALPAQAADSAVERQTRYGPVIGVDDAAGSGT